MRGSRVATTLGQHLQSAASDQETQMRSISPTDFLRCRMMHQIPLDLPNLVVYARRRYSYSTCCMKRTIPWQEPRPVPVRWIACQCSSHVDAGYPNNERTLWLEPRTQRSDEVKQRLLVMER